MYIILPISVRLFLFKLKNTLIIYNSQQVNVAKQHKGKVCAPSHLLPRFVCLSLFRSNLSF